MSTSIIFNAISGLPINNGSSISVSIGKKNPKYTNNNNVNFNLEHINSKYQNKFLKNNIEYNLWHGNQMLPDTTSIAVSRTPTPTPTATVVAPTLTSTTTPTPTSTPTVSQSPTPTSSVIISITTNTANFNNCAGNVSNVGTNGISSYYGAYDMAGNVWEWTETPVGLSSRVFRGGNYTYDTSYLSSSYRNYAPSVVRVPYLGFRIASKQLSPSYSALIYVGDINNNADVNGFGSLSYSYYIGKNEITNEEYIEFLNAVATTDTNALYISNMSTDTYGGILRSGSVGSYSYSPKTNMPKRPVNYLNWGSCARYCNWLHNGKPTGQQVSGITENGAYNMSTNTPIREANALYFLATENEWYKAAFYKGNGSNSGYWSYPTQSDTAPSCVTISSIGNAIV
jgi:formylglycine-generating enzyme required for sulfatase activity